MRKCQKILGYDSPNGYHYIEKGRSKFSAEALAQVADILKVTIDSLFWGKNPPKWRKMMSYKLGGYTRLISILNHSVKSSEKKYKK